MTAQKPVYSRPSDDDPTPAPRRKRRRKRAHRNKSVHTTDTLAAAQVKEIAEHDPLHENDGVAEHHPTTTGAHHKRKNATLTAVNESFTPHEDDGVAFHDPITEAKCITKRDHLQDDGDGVPKRDPTTEAKGMAKRHPLQDDGDAVAEHHPTGTDGQNRQNTSFDHHKRNRRTHHREKRRARELRAENERLHRRLAAIYDALSID